MSGAAGADRQRARELEHGSRPPRRGARVGRVRGLHPGRHLRAVRRLHLHHPAAGKTGVPLVSDAAEALGATHKGGRPAASGRWRRFPSTGTRSSPPAAGERWSPTTREWAAKARWLSTQARDPAPHYQHSSIGYNYRLSNLLAALGRAQLSDLKRRVDIRRAHNKFYREALGDLPGVEFMPEAPGSRSTFWLTTFTIDPPSPGSTGRRCGSTSSRSTSRRGRCGSRCTCNRCSPTARCYGGAVSQRLFEHGLCIPSGSSLTESQRDRVVTEIRSVFGQA